MISQKQSTVHSKHKIHLCNPSLKLWANGTSGKGKKTILRHEIKKQDKLTLLVSI